jgi:hypothetical protein
MVVRFSRLFLLLEIAVAKSSQTVQGAGSDCKRCPVPADTVRDGEDGAAWSIVLFGRHFG